MKLWYHPESDSLYLSEEWDGLSDDVSESLFYRMVAIGKGMDLSKVEFDGEDIGEPPEVTSHTMADAIVKSYKRWERKPADLYPTPVDATESIIDILKLMEAKRVWEPACGDGRIARVLEWHGIEVHGTDLREHTGYGQGGLDFINDDPMEKWGWDVEGMRFDAIITNPPFSLAREFIEKALSITPNVIMLVKQNYYNTAGRYDFFQDMRPSFFLPLTWRLAFLPERGKSPLMDCAWAVWTDKADHGDMTIMEPIKRRKYPGYQGAGLRSAMAALTEALDECAGAIRGPSA